MISTPIMLMLPTVDRVRSEAFYRAVFNWQSRSIGPQAAQLVTDGLLNVVLVEQPYLSLESGIIPAIRGLSTIAVVSVASRDELPLIMQRVESAGGTVTSSARERDFGISSVYFTDPDGNAWEALWQPASE